MKTIDETISMINIQITRQTVETYISHEWLRPVLKEDDWYFEEIDVARLYLVHHLVEDIQVNDAGMDVALSLLDQLYALRLKALEIKIT